MQIKVNNTRMQVYDKVNKNFALEVPVVEGKLVLIEDRLLSRLDAESPVGGWKPIIISETEKIEVDDWFWHQDGYEQVKDIQGKFVNGFILEHCRKILALPEQFSPKHLQAIVDGKMKDGNKVLVECEDLCDYEGEELWENTPHFIIKTNHLDHVTLHKVEEKMYTKEEIKKIAEDAYLQGFLSSGIKFDSHEFNQWFEKNVK